MKSFFFDKFPFINLSQINCHKIVKKTKIVAVRNKNIGGRNHQITGQRSWGSHSLKQKETKTSIIISTLIIFPEIIKNIFEWSKGFFCTLVYWSISLYRSQNIHFNENLKRKLTWNTSSMRTCIYLFLCYIIISSGNFIAQSLNKNILDSISRHSERTNSNALLIYQNGKPIIKNYFGKRSTGFTSDRWEIYENIWFYPFSCYSMTWTYR